MFRFLRSVFISALLLSVILVGLKNYPVGIFYLNLFCVPSGKTLVEICESLTHIPQGLRYRACRVVASLLY